MRVLLSIFVFGWLAASLAQGQGMASQGAARLPGPGTGGREFPARFVEVATKAGLTGAQISGGPERRYILEAMGTGIACFDYDNDGWIDIFLVSGTRFSPPAAKTTNRLYKNNGKGGFSDVTVQAGLTRSGWGQSVAAADYDNDGDTDLFVTYWGQNALYQNNGNGTFTDTAAAAGLAGDPGRWSSGASFLDFDRDGHLDLFVASYLVFDPAKTPKPGSGVNCVWMGTPVFCGPRGLPFSTNSLHRGRGDGTFEDVSAASGIGAVQKTYALGVLAADMDGDDWPDIYVASDSTRSLFFHNNADGTFSERATYMGLAYDENGLEQAGMGAALGDYDGDGRLDIVKTNFADDYPNLYRNLGKGAYTDRALHAGLGVNPQYVLWSAAFADFDNDTRPDLFLSAGHVFPSGPKAPRLLYWNLGNGKFADVSARLGPGIYSSRGGAVCDFDNDGHLDIVVMNMNEAPSLLHNQGVPSTNWLKFALRGTRSNRMAIGARVRVSAGGRWQTQAVLSQSGYYSSNDPRIHFGLGPATVAEAVEIVWPDGNVQRWRDVKANQVFQAVEE